MLFNDLLAFLQRRLCNMIRPLTIYTIQNLLLAARFIILVGLCRYVISAFVQWEIDLCSIKLTLAGKNLCLHNLFVFCFVFRSPSPHRIQNWF